MVTLLGEITYYGTPLPLPFLADHTIGRAFGTLCRLSVCLSSVCDVLYCCKTVRPSEKLSEGVNRKPYYLWSRSLGLKTVQHCIGGVLWKGPGTAFRMHCKVFGRPYYRSSLWYSMSSVCSLSSVCDVLYCGKTVRPSEKVSEGVNRKPGSKS